MSHVQHLKTLTTIIQSRNNYIGHIVLDAGKVNVLVLAKNGLYNYTATHRPHHQWHKLTENEAREVAERCFHSNSFKELMKLKDN